MVEKEGKIGGLVGKLHGRHGWRVTIIPRRIEALDKGPQSDSRETRSAVLGRSATVGGQWLGKIDTQARSAAEERSDPGGFDLR